MEKLLYTRHIRLLPFFVCSTEESSKCFVYFILAQHHFPPPPAFITTPRRFARPNHSFPSSLLSTTTTTTMTREAVCLHFARYTPFRGRANTQTVRAKDAMFSQNEHALLSSFTKQQDRLRVPCGFPQHDVDSHRRKHID